MNLALLCEPLPALFPLGGEENDLDAYGPGTLAARLTAYRAGGPFPADWPTADLALLGVDTPYGAEPAGPATGPDAIRRHLYALTTGTGAWNLVDLGNLRPGPTPEDTAHRLAEVVDALLAAHVVPLILGDAHRLTLGQHAGYEYRIAEGPEAADKGLALPVSVRGAVIDSRFDVAEMGPGERTWLRELLLQDPSHLLTLAHLGAQRYHITAPEAIALEKMYFDVLRLGALHADPRVAEPLLRAADWLSIDLSACTHAAVPGAAQPPSPFGLTAEQLCQLTWYAGQSRQLSSVGFYGYRAGPTDPLGLGAATVATAVWYLIEGYYHRPPDTPLDSAAYERLTVPLADSAEANLTFYHHHTSGQWWLLIEPPAAPPHLLPCTEADYHTARSGDVPHRWVQALARS